MTTCAFYSGMRAYSPGGYISSYEYKPISKEAQQALIPNGTNTLAVHCHQTGGGQYIDVGLTERIPPQK